MDSCLYFGTIGHRRFEPKPHVFNYDLFMVYLDLGELAEVFQNSRLWSTDKPALAWFCRSDYLGDPKQPLAEAVCDLVENSTGQRPQGPIRLLTHLRYFGYCFNPVSFYYCFDRSGQRVETVVAEITNTPWHERFSYVLCSAMDSGQADHHRYYFTKAFHVSPFFPMNLAYDWHFIEPGSELAVQMQLIRDDSKVFDAKLSLRRQEITPQRLTSTLYRYPAMTIKIVTAIYYQAALLKLKDIPFYAHP